MNFKLEFDCKREIAETPIWDTRINKLYWTDLFGGSVNIYDPKDGTNSSYEMGSRIGSAIPCSDTSLVLVFIENGIFLFNKETGEKQLVSHPASNFTESRYNDSRVDKAGRILTSVTSMHYGTDKYRFEDMKGGFFMIDTDGSIHEVCRDIALYNGIVWNRDSTKMFVIDSYNFALLEFDYDINSGPKGHPKVALDLKTHGIPDGISIDSQDNLYICHWGGSLTVWDKNLTSKEIIKFPVSQLCCGGFGGENLKDFYVTTALLDYSEQQKKENPGAGGIFLAKSEISGTLDNYYPVP